MEFSNQLENINSLNVNRNKLIQPSSVNKKLKALSDVKNTLHFLKTPNLNAIAKSSTITSACMEVGVSEVVRDLEQDCHHHDKCEFSLMDEKDLAELRFAKEELDYFSNINKYILPKFVPTISLPLMGACEEATTWEYPRSSIVITEIEDSALTLVAPTFEDIDWEM